MIQKIINNEGFRFIVVGIINTLVGTIIMYSMYNIFNLSYFISTFSNYFFTSILSFFLNKFFTFKNNNNSLNQVIKFIINIVVCYVVAYAIAKPLVITLLSGQSIKIQENIAMVVGMVLFTMLNFIGQKFFTFNK